MAHARVGDDDNGGCKGLKVGVSHDRRASGSCFVAGLALHIR
jgi:hypothetical protein